MSAAAPAPLIRLAGINKVYGSGESAVHALADVNLDIPHGAFMSIMGPSGSGKSTCLNLLGCLDTPSSGDYLLDGVEVGRLEPAQKALIRRHAIGFVFQGFNLLKRTSALENVELPLIYRGLPARERRERAMAALARVGLANRAGHSATQLSGGQQQRVAIARAIVTDPLLLLADEPTGNLDSALGKEILELLRQLNRDQGVTVIIVTHDAHIGAQSDRCVRFLDGRIVADESFVHPPAAPRSHSAGSEVTA